jgi:hypothetical protein
MMSMSHNHDVRTTLTLDDDVSAKLSAEVRRSGRSFKQVVNDFLRRGLNARREMKPLHPFRIDARDLGLRPGFQLDNVWELIDQVEGPGSK